MSLSQKAKDGLRRAITDDKAAVEIEAAIDSGANPVAADVAAFGSIASLVGVDGTGSNAAPLATTQTRLANIEAKINAILSALKAAGLMS